MLLAHKCVEALEVVDGRQTALNVRIRRELMITRDDGIPSGVVGYECVLPWLQSSGSNRRNYRLHRVCRRERRPGALRNAPTTAATCKGRVDLLQKSRFSLRIVKVSFARLRHFGRGTGCSCGSKDAYAGSIMPPRLQYWLRKGSRLDVAMDVK